LDNVCVLSSLGPFCVHHRRAVLLVWLVTFVDSPELLGS
jgi:hypothetical protein